MLKNYADIIFLSGDDAEEALQILNDKGEDAVINYLQQWENGEEAITQNNPAGLRDTQYRQGSYIMSYNEGLGYIGLIKELSLFFNQKYRKTIKHK